MNTRMNLLAGIVLGSAMMVGCEERPEARPAPDRTTTPPTTTTTPPRTTTDTTTTTTSPGTNTQDARALTLIQRCQQHIDAMEYEQAELVLKELESIKANVSSSTARQIEQLRNDLNRAKGDTTTTPPSTTPPPPGR